MRLITLIITLALLTPAVAVGAQDSAPAPESDSTPESTPPPESDSAPESDPNPEVEPTAGPKLAPTVGPDLTVDSLGRPFPDPALLKAAGGRVALGVALTASGVTLTLVGLNTATAIARGEILVGERGLALPLGMMGGGALLTAAGIPMISHGSQMRGQLLRKTRGVEKLPRSVANEAAYWRAHMQADYARTITIGGGGSILLGTLSLVAVAGLVGQSGYDPRFWAAPIVSFALGGALIPAGIQMRKHALAKMEKVRDAVDPLRQKGGKLSMASPSEDDLQPLARRARAQVSIPQPLVSLTRDDRGNTGTVLGLAWSIRY